jgi:hypothetical protein
MRRSFWCLSETPCRGATATGCQLLEAHVRRRNLAAVCLSPLETGTSDSLSLAPAPRRYAESLLLDREEVDDLMHGYLVHALGLLRIRRNDAEIRTWLFTIMHNLYLSRVWRRRPRRKSEPPEIDEDDLHAYIDGQLLIWRHLAVERNLEANPEAARRVAAYRAQRDALRVAFAIPHRGHAWVKAPGSS